MKEYISVINNSSVEITEKKSKFIAHVSHVETAHQAEDFITNIKKIHYNATHNVFAYLLKDGFKKYSDDGEPAKTAGFPILDMLENENITDTVCVVTRYFGGTLLGVGGLIRAYTKAAKEGIKAAGIPRKTLCKCIDITIDYTFLNKLMHILNSQNIIVENTNYLEKVTVTAIIELKKSEAFLKELLNVFNGQINIKEKEKLYYNIKGDV